MSEHSDTTPSKLEIKNNEISNDEKISVSTLQREFILPKKIKQVRILIAMGQIVMGIVLIVLPAYYFANPASTELSLQLLAIVAILAGVVLVLLFPTNLARSINSKLILGEKSILLRNTFSYKEIFWKDLQEILLTEKLSSDPNTNVSIGANILRFRTITKGFYYFVDSYPVEDIKKMKESIKETFKIALTGTGYTVMEKTERPSIKSRFVYYEKAIEESSVVVTE